MLNSYQTHKQHHDEESNIIHLNSLTYAYNLTKLFPYPAIENISYSLNPKMISRSKYEELVHDCEGFDKILMQMYNNMPKLIQYYRDYASGDPLVLTFLELYDAVSKIGFNRKKPSVYINRHDFMYDLKLEEFIEVEYNLTAASAGFHAHNIKSLLQHYYKQRDEAIDFVDNKYTDFHIETFLKFWGAYNNPEAYIAIVLSEGEWNIFETIQNQKLLLDAGIKTMKILAENLHKENFWLDEFNNLVYKGKEIGMVYYRYLYDATHFINDSKNFVIAAEVSNAICLPSLETWLINTKMNQYLIYARSVQEKYGITHLDIKHFKRHLCPHYMLKDSFGNDKIRMIEFVKRDIDNFLLKTFREGGFGEIIGGNDILDFIAEQSEEILNRYLLVKKIKTPSAPSVCFIEGNIKFFEETVSELGIFTSAVLKMSDSKVWGVDWQSGSGYLMRTKPKSTMKGGIAVNASFVDVLAFNNEV